MFVQDQMRTVSQNAVPGVSGTLLRILSGALKRIT